MKVFEITKGSTSLQGLRMVERDQPEPAADQVLVRVRATSLNYRDLAIISGNYFAGSVQHDTVPLSDGAGEVVAVGDSVERFKVGDRVAVGRPAGIVIVGHTKRPLLSSKGHPLRRVIINRNVGDVGIIWRVDLEGDLSAIRRPP